MNRLITDLNVPLQCVEIPYHFIRIAAMAIKISEDLQTGDDQADEHGKQLREAMLRMDLANNPLSNDESDDWQVAPGDKVQDKSTGNHGIVRLSDRKQDKWMVQYQEDDANVCLGISYYSNDNMIKSAHHKVK